MNKITKVSIVCATGDLGMKKRQRALKMYYWLKSQLSTPSEEKPVKLDSDPNKMLRQSFDKALEVLRKPYLQLEALHDIYRKEHPRSDGKFYIPDSTELCKWIVEKITSEGEWISVEGNLSLFKIMSKYNCPVLFDNGVECRFNDEHPYAILTHFKITPKQ